MKKSLLSAVAVTALVAFLIMAFVVYFFIVKPYEAAKARFQKPVEDEVDPQIALLRVQRAEDDTVLEVIQQLHGALDNAAVIGIRKRAVTIGVPAAVTEWLKAHPLT